MIIPTEKWSECLKCPYCYDDDEGLYCELDKCERAKTGESEVIQRSEVVTM
jgi:hypothetical protein